MVLVTFSIQMLRHVKEINILCWYFSDVFFSLFPAIFIKFQFCQKYKINLISVSEWFPYKCVIKLGIKYASDVFKRRWFQLLVSNISLKGLLWILPPSMHVKNKFCSNPWKFLIVLERKILASEINLIWSDI